LKVKDLLKLYRNDSVVQTIAETTKPNEDLSIKITGLVGSLDAVLIGALYGINHQNHLIVLHDKEEAAYFHSDLQNLLQSKEVLFFPTSYKRAYEFEETENANILMRAEILNRINHKASSGEIIVTYPEALTERVINKRSLTQNTFTLKTGEKVDVEFLAELLITYDFEKTDFVYEAGQYAVRGGIIDVFSYAHDLPYRIELFGNEIESIRTFDPSTQLSEETIKEINIIPNVQTKLIQEKREAFLNFVPNNTKVWFKDYQHTLDIIDKYFVKASDSFNQILEGSGDIQMVLNPEDLFETANTFSTQAKKLVKIEFGNRFYLKTTKSFDVASKPQPSFNKDFDILVKDVSDNKTHGFTTLISAESNKQLERLENIFQELDPQHTFQGVNIGLR
jgi:transcription-repair coupling factor (superfamily II helicase)